jgi:hypothetical protein
LEDNGLEVIASEDQGTADDERVEHKPFNKYGKILFHQERLNQVAEEAKARKEGKAWRRKEKRESIERIKRASLQNVANFELGREGILAGNGQMLKNRRGMPATVSDDSEIELETGQLWRQSAASKISTSSPDFGVKKSSFKGTSGKEVASSAYTASFSLLPASISPPKSTPTVFPSSWPASIPYQDQQAFSHGSTRIYPLEYRTQAQRKADVLKELSKISGHDADNLIGNYSRHRLLPADDQKADPCGIHVFVDFSNVSYLTP